jgi:hypothetical protein
MTKHRDLAIPASAPTQLSAPPVVYLAGARFPYYGYYFGSFSGRYA